MVSVSRTENYSFIRCFHSTPICSRFFLYRRRKEGGRRTCWIVKVPHKTTFSINRSHERQIRVDLRRFWCTSSGRLLAEEWSAHPRGKSGIFLSFKTFKRYSDLQFLCFRQSPFYREIVEESTNKISEIESVLPTRGLASTKSRLVIDCVDGDAEAIYTCVAESVNEKIVSSTYVHIEGISKWNQFFKGWKLNWFILKLKVKPPLMSQCALWDMRRTRCRPVYSCGLELTSMSKAKTQSFYVGRLVIQFRKFLGILVTICPSPQA